MNEALTNLEKRVFPLKLEALTVETRAANGQATEVLKGKAAVFDEFTEITNRWGDKFMEKFSKNCMDETLADGHKVMALFNHDWSCLMGSTADNLKLEKKADGLYFEFTPKGFEFDRRITELVRSGTIDGCSIGYRVPEDNADGTRNVLWDKKDGLWHRCVEKIELYEVSFTPIPAYEQTTVDVEVRKLDAPEENDEPPDGEERKRIIAEAEETLKRISK